MTLLTFNGYSALLVTSVHVYTAHCAVKINSVLVKGWDRGRWAGVTRHLTLSSIARLGLENIALYSNSFSGTVGSFQSAWTGGHWLRTLSS